MIRYLARADIVLDSPLHIGTGKESGVTDMPVFRDAFDDYRIPGTSLAGIFRNRVARSRHGEETANKLFGRIGASGEDGHGSRIVLSDAYLLDFDGGLTLVKHLNGAEANYPNMRIVQDSVRIDPETGTAEDGGKFDFEVVPEGTRFRFELDYAPGDEGDRVDIVTELFYDLAEGNLQVGGFLSRGFGFFHAEHISINRFNLANPDDLTAWIRIHRSPDLDAITVGEKVPPGGAGLEGGAHSEGISGSIKISLAPEGPLLLAGASQSTTGPLDADIRFFELPIVSYAKDKSGIEYRPCVPGTALKGLIRSRVSQILRSLGHSDPGGIVDRLFGSVDGPDAARKSKVLVKGCSLKETSYEFVQHVAIDRITGGALIGALYAEAPIWSEDVAISLEIVVDRLSDFEAGLLFHAIMDLGEGRLPIGNGTRRGNGKLRFASAIDHALGDSVQFLLHRNGKAVDHSTPIPELQNLLNDVSVGYRESCDAGGTN